ncbi:response regulator [Actinoplanes oblitus]|uniref:Response regulator n=1 Tax=Actinoplanes oblitus TaxID=3040509 RepID=A0ABY8W6Z8_9ACTN|nr:response regulator [Actinoplanes oblitus]WIM93443.1 response regulator [Actinoplanes oblitus]
MANKALDVLIVDDDDADTLMIEEALLTAEPPPAVHRVADGSEAMDYLFQRGQYADAARPDLILLDLNMPRMNGHEVLAQVKSDDTLKSIPVVVLTTSTALPDITASYTRHANAFVTKPMDLDGFEDAVGKIRRFYSEVAILP